MKNTNTTNATKSNATVKKSTVKKSVATVDNVTKSNATLDFTVFLTDINTVNANGELLYGYKNNVQLSLAKCGIMVNANSSKYVPTDAYVRFKNNSQFQLQYSAKQNKFVGFNIRLCATAHIDRFKKWFAHFDRCNDNARIYKTEFIALDNFNAVINELITLPKFDRDTEKI